MKFIIRQKIYRKMYSHFDKTNAIYPMISDIIRDDIIVEFETTQPLYDMCTKVEINNEEHVITGIKRLASDEVIFYIEDKIIEDEITKESYDKAKIEFDKYDTGESICFMDYEQYEKHIKERNGESSENKEDIKNESLTDKIKNCFKKLFL